MTNVKKTTDPSVVRRKKRRDPKYDDLPMKQSKLIKRILIFVLVLIMPTMLWGITGLLGLNDNLDFDTYENRNKHEFAEDTTLGNLTAEAEAYYNDRVPFRAVLLSVDRTLNDLLEFPYKKGIEPMLLWIANRNTQTADTASSANKNLILKVQNKILSLTGEAGDNALAGIEHDHIFHLTEHKDPDYENYGYDKYRCLCGEEKIEYLEKPIDDSYFPYVDSEVIEGRYDWLFFYEEIGDYVGGGLPDGSELEQAASLLQSLQASAEGRGAQFFCLSFPNKSRVYSEYMPTLDKGDPWRLKIFSDYLTNENPSPFSYLYEEMMAEKPAHSPYYKHDTHWNYYGAIVALNAIHSYVGMDSIDINKLPNEEYPYAGDLSIMQGSPRNETCYKPVYKPEVNVTSEYDDSDGGHGFFSMGMAEFYSDAENDKTVVMIGDSYQVALMEYLPKDYTHVVFINRGYLESIGPSVIPTADIVIYEFVERKSGYMMGDLSLLTSMMG